MGKIESLTLLLAIVALLLSLWMYLMRQKRMITEMKVNSMKPIYLKRKSFKYMKNAGDDPCETAQDFDLYATSQKFSFFINKRMVG